MRPRDFSTSPRPSRPGARDLALVVGSLLLVGGAAAEAWRAQAALTAASSRVAEMRPAMDSDRARARALESGHGAGERFASQALLTADADPPRVLSELTGLLPPDVRFQRLTLTYGETLELDLEVAARDSGAYDLFLKRLTGSPRVRDVRPGAENREGEVRATVRAAYAPVGQP